ncbi:MAG: LPS export ABC transporter periplasmic protein LptC [Candidatus Eremiobacteraeota bacterium]|nr:LPS export ABC transporter periplasmic protein LptC [Candidatus Eremiobacteraeota bacterium]
MKRCWLLLGIVGLAACSPQPQHAASAPTAAASVQASPTIIPFQITGHGKPGQPVRFFEQDGNRKLYEVQAKSFVGVRGSSATANLRHAHVIFYDRDGTTLTADSPLAVVDEKTKRVTMSGGVHALTSTGIALLCDELTYDHVTDRVHGQGNVKITKQGYTLTGTTIDSDLSLSQVHMQ